MRNFMDCFAMLGFYKAGCWLLPTVLEVGSSGRLKGTMSTYPGNYKCPGSRVMTKNLPGGFFYRVRYLVTMSRLNFRVHISQEIVWTSCCHILARYIASTSCRNILIRSLNIWHELKFRSCCNNQHCMPKIVSPEARIYVDKKMV